MKKIIFICCISLFFISNIFSIPLSELHIVADDGTFLGSFENKYSKNSIYNEYGDFGSPYGNNSLMNIYSNYSSDYSDKSPFNKYANHAPWLFDNRGKNYGRLSINKYASGVTDDSYKIAYQLKALRDSFR